MTSTRPSSTVLKRRCRRARDDDHRGREEPPTTKTEIYREARDLLQNLGQDYDKAVAGFSWPDFGDRFNWAVDWFDAIARGNQRTALWIAEEDGGEATYSFDAMARRSDQ